MVLFAQRNSDINMKNKLGLAFNLYIGISFLGLIVNGFLVLLNSRYLDTLKRMHFYKGVHPGLWVLFSLIIGNVCIYLFYSRRRIGATYPNQGIEVIFLLLAFLGPVPIWDRMMSDFSMLLRL